MSLLIVSTGLGSEKTKSLLLAREAERVLRADGTGCTLLDLRDLTLPLCGTPESFTHANTTRATELVSAASAILLSTPIYNYDANAVAKNFVELTGKGWENKVVGFMCAAGGHASRMSILTLANSLMLDFRCVIVPRFVYATSSAFGADGSISDPDIAGRIAQCARTTVKLAGAVQGLR
jgi:NAD(P)H-dependent FMN reductase